MLRELREKQAPLVTLRVRVRVVPVTLLSQLIGLIVGTAPELYPRARVCVRPISVNTALTLLLGIGEVGTVV